MQWLSFALLVVFLLCGLIYSRAGKELARLDQIRLEKEPPPGAELMPFIPPAFAKKMGMALTAGSEELKIFCDRNGLAEDYKRANRLLHGAIAVALLCAFIIVKLGATSAAAP